MDEQAVFQVQVERNLRRLRLATAAAYLVGFALLALTVGLSLAHVNDAHRHLETVMAQHDTKVRLITETQLASFRRADAVQALFLETDPFRQDERYMAFLRHGFQVGDGRNRIRSLLSSEAERAVLARQDAIIAEAVLLHDEVADLARAGHHEQARALFADQVAKLHDEGHATFQALRDLQTQAAQQAIAAANAAFHTTVHNAIAAVLLSLAAGISIGLLMHQTSHRISRRLHDNVGNLRHMAMHDSLTGLLNRTAIIQILGSKITAANPFALLYMDLDGFKQINDRHGHAVGDQLLAMAAARIRGRMRGIDIVARIGGDEFVAVLEGIDNPDEAEHAARHVIEAFEQPFVHQDAEATVGVSIGITLAPMHTCSADEVLTSADRAMYRAKSRGSNGYEVHLPAPGLAPARRAAG